MELQAEMLGCDSLANRSNEMAIWRELATRIQPLQLGNSAVDVGDGRWELNAQGWFVGDA
jgi:hypothetical protein